MIRAWCPDCNAKPGTRCKRPSGHVAQSLYASRISAAERLDVEADLPWTRRAMPQLTLEGT